MKTCQYILILLISVFCSPIFGQKTVGRIVVEDKTFLSLIDSNQKLEVISEGYEWSEGPVWIKNGSYLLFSDVPKNTIFKWKEGITTTFLSPSGYTGLLPYGSEPGSNGLALSADGSLLACEHGDRRISKMPLNIGGKITLADKWSGKRFNSPNDLTEATNGNIYFTDPPYGLPNREKDSSREIEQFGVYLLNKKGEVKQIISDLIRPNGVCLSPDQKTLYVAQSDAKAFIMAYPLKADGSCGKGQLLYDARTLQKKGLKGAPDGIRTDKYGNIWSSGPGGVIILDPKGKLLGRIETGQYTANLCFGEDGSTLFITADMLIIRVKTKTIGTGF
jgi:gluconolactonase